MSYDSKTALTSKLVAFTVCYQKAKRLKDLKRMVLLGPIISDLKDEIALLKD